MDLSHQHRGQGVLLGRCHTEQSLTDGQGLASFKGMMVLAVVQIEEAGHKCQAKALLFQGLHVWTCAFCRDVLIKC